MAVDYGATVSSPRPSPAAAFSVGVYQSDRALHLSVRRRNTVVVLGYLGEPFLRIDAAGVWINTASPTASATVWGAETSVLPANRRFRAYRTEFWHPTGVRWTGLSSVSAVASLSQPTTDRTPLRGSRIRGFRAQIRALPDGFDGDTKLISGLLDGLEARMAQHEGGLMPQPWDWPGPRVLLEQPYRMDTRARVDALRRAGYAVSVCPGPTAEERCPLAGEEGCAAAHGADIVVSSLRLETPEAREALAALRTRLPRLPVLVEAETDAAAHWPELVHADDLLEPGIGADALVDRVRLALERKWKARA